MLKHSQSEDIPLYHPSIKERPSFLSTDSPRPSLPCTAALGKNRGFQEGKDSHGLSNSSVRDLWQVLSPLWVLVTWALKWVRATDTHSDVCKVRQLSLLGHHTSSGLGTHWRECWWKSGDSRSCLGQPRGSRPAGCSREAKNPSFSLKISRLLHLAN